MKMSGNEYAEAFREEAAELLAELETSLLELEESPDDKKLVGRVFRNMHTLKGSGSMFGFDDVATFAHQVETVLDKVRNGDIPVSKTLIDLTLEARDHIKKLLESLGGGEIDAESGLAIIAAMNRLGDGDASAAVLAEAEAAGSATVQPVSTEPVVREAAVAKDEAAREEPRLVHYLVRLEPGPDFFTGGGDIAALVPELAKLGECTVLAECCQDRVTRQEACDCDSFVDFIVSTAAGENAIRDVLIFVESSCKVTVTEGGAGSDGEEGHKRLGEILVERGDITAEGLNRALSQQRPLGEILVENELTSPLRVESALVAQRELDKKQNAAKAAASESIRVAADKLDRLIDLVGELVVTQARLSEIASAIEHPGLAEPVEEVERLTAELRDSVLNVRMMAIGITFGKFRRLVRDLSSELGKEVRMVTSGAETELDKTVIERLSEPLIHLIRNCIDHGIEAPAERLAKGKSAEGEIRLIASYAGAQVLIEVIDDGRGIDSDKLFAKAVEKGVVKAGAELSREEINNLIFAPGLSTAAKVSNVSGRGVGMDVVMNTIRGLKGKVVVASEAGRGTTISIRLPLTLAIIDGLLVKAGDTHFVLPLEQVEECVELSREDIARFHGRRVLQVRDHLVPYVRLRDFFAMDGERPDLEQMVIVHADGDPVGMVLDNVIGEHQTVIKSLGWVYRNAEGLSGATILGNGEVALIVDVATVVKQARDAEAASV